MSVSDCDFQVVRQKEDALTNLDNSCFFFNKHYFKVNFISKYLGLQKLCEDGTREFLYTHGQFPLLLASYVSMAQFSQLMNQQSFIIN